MPYTVNGQSVNVRHEPRVVSGTMWVPLRELATAMGANVDFEPSSHAPIVYLGSDIVTLQSGKAEADLNGETIPLSAAPFIYEGETFVPVRLFEKLPGVSLQADPSSLQVDITQTAQT